MSRENRKRRRLAKSHAQEAQMKPEEGRVIDPFTGKPPATIGRLAQMAYLEALETQSRFAMGRLS